MPPRAPYPAQPSRPSNSNAFICRTLLERCYACSLWIPRAVAGSLAFKKPANQGASPRPSQRPCILAFGLQGPPKPSSFSRTFRGFAAFVSARRHTTLPACEPRGLINFGDIRQHATYASLRDKNAACYSHFTPCGATNAV